jgi:hypothetical protein
MKKILKRNIYRNIWIIKSTFLFQKIKRWMNPNKRFHIDKIEKILAAKTLFNIDLFIETGTYLGVTTNYVRKYFSKIYSIELSKDLAKEACSYFKNKKNITIIQGDSGLLIGEILKENTSKKIFWLDAHYSAGITACSTTFGDTPISKEIEEILKYWVTESVILIDDARLFTGKDNYPTVSDLTKFITDKNQKLKVFLDKDIIHIL